MAFYFFYFNLHKSETVVLRACAISINVSRDGLENATSIFPTKFKDMLSLSANSC